LLYFVNHTSRSVQSLLITNRVDLSVSYVNFEIWIVFSKSNFNYQLSNIEELHHLCESCLSIFHSKNFSTFSIFFISNRSESNRSSYLEFGNSCSNTNNFFWEKPCLLFWYIFFTWYLWNCYWYLSSEQSSQINNYFSPHFWHEKYDTSYLSLVKTFEPIIRWPKGRVHK
jgi:hypothetical protein